MVSFYQPKKKPKQGSKAPIVSVNIDAWDAQGRGVSRSHTPVVFVDGALPGEVVKVKLLQQKKQFSVGEIIAIEQASVARIKPFCPIYQQCGGCQLQHVSSSDALEFRQAAINEQLIRQLPIDSVAWSVALSSETPNYRRKTRLALDARNPRDIKIGFRARQQKQVIDIDSCPVLVSELQQLIQPLKKVLHRLSGIRYIGHISMLKADNGVLIALRTTRQLSIADQQLLSEFAATHAINLELQGNENNVTSLYVAHDALVCSTEGDLTIAPGADDFVQVNAGVNQAMIQQAMDWLQVEPSEDVVDWFSGLGNFSLSLAKRGAKVTAVEGVKAMTEKAQNNALQQGITSITWRHSDLNDPKECKETLNNNTRKVLLDPSREGALSAVEVLAKNDLERVLYVSCNPASFIRDAKVLCEGGFSLKKISLLEMFPYTHHTELMALFTKPDTNE